MAIALVLGLGLALALAASDAGARGMRKVGTSRGAKKTHTVVVLDSLEDGRQYASIVDRKRPALDRLDGTLRSSASEAQVAAFLESGELLLVDERVDYGEAGGTARNRYYVSGGRLVYYESLHVRPRDVGEGRLPARDEVLTSLAFGENGTLVGSEKTVNRERVALGPTEEPRVRQRFEALAAKVDESLGKKPKKR